MSIGFDNYRGKENLKSIGAIEERLLGTVLYLMTMNYSNAILAKDESYEISSH